MLKQLIIYFLSSSILLGDSKIHSSNFNPLEIHICDEKTEDNHFSQDPIEPLNRASFEFNRLLDGLLLEPIANIFSMIVPDPIKESLSVSLDIFFSPINFINFALQKKTDKFVKRFMRTVLNSTAGCFLIDVASYANLPKEETSFSETLAFYNVPKGPYLMLPVMGPTTIRGALGMFIDYLITPWNYLKGTNRCNKKLWTNRLYGIYAFDLIYKRYKYIDVFNDLQNEFDPYTTIRNVYLQKISVMETDIKAHKPFKDVPLSRDDKRSLT